MKRSGIRRFVAAAFAALLAAAANAGAQPMPEQPEASRGELLYTTHCVACHNARVHWRDQRLATDWKSLRAQVRRWQGVQELRWSEADITEVARYLNTFYYDYPSPDR